LCTQSLAFIELLVGDVISQGLLKLLGTTYVTIEPHTVHVSRPKEFQYALISLLLVFFPGVYIVLVLLMSAVSVILSIHSIQIYHRDPEEEPVPKWQGRFAHFLLKVLKPKCKK
jgi:hypothetical protein